MGAMKELVIKEESMQIEFLFDGAKYEKIELDRRNREAHEEAMRNDYSFEEYLEQERKTHR